MEGDIPERPQAGEIRPRGPEIDIVEIETGRGRFTARCQGRTDLPVVLLLHGFPDAPHTFDALGDRLAAAGFRAVAPFARGYDPSPPFPNPADGEQSVFEQLANDVIAIADALSPERPVRIVGHDNGGFTAYYAMSDAPSRFSRAVTLTAGHPAAVFSNTTKSPRQLWKSRYAFLFQMPKLSDWYAERRGFRYLRELWVRWAAPGWTIPEDHWREVRQVMQRSWPTPLEHYRAMAFSGPDTRIFTPTLYLLGDMDGCVERDTGVGQERYFSGSFEQRTIVDAGHFLHLEKPDVVLPMIVDWLRRT